VTNHYHLPAPPLIAYFCAALSGVFAETGKRIAVSFMFVRGEICNPEYGEQYQLVVIFLVNRVTMSLTAVTMGKSEEILALLCAPTGNHAKRETRKPLLGQSTELPSTRYINREI
jgi:hypothetical protein